MTKQETVMGMIAKVDAVAQKIKSIRESSLYYENPYSTRVLGLAENSLKAAELGLGDIVSPYERVQPLIAELRACIKTIDNLKEELKSREGYKESMSVSYEDVIVNLREAIIELEEVPEKEEEEEEKENEE